MAYDNVNRTTAYRAGVAVIAIKLNVDAATRYPVIMEWAFDRMPAILRHACQITAIVLKYGGNGQVHVRPGA